MLLNRRNLLLCGTALCGTALLPRNALALTTLQSRSGTCSDDLSSNTSIWDDDKAYTLRVDRVSDTIGDRKAIKYSGDIVSLSERYTRSLIREPSGPADNVSLLTVDARRIELDGSLSFKNAHINLLSLELTISELGLITIFGDYQSTFISLNITSENLFLVSETYLKPINIYPDNQGKLPAISISIGTVWRDGALVGETEARDLIWQLIAASDELESPPSTVKIEVGDLARASHARSLKQQCIWPAEVYSKALRLHAAYPFDCGVQQAITFWVEKLAPLLEKSSLPQASAGMPVLAARIAANLDAFGHGPNWAPRKSLTKQISDFEKTISSFEGKTGQNSFSDDLIEMIASGFEKTAPDPNKLKELELRKEDITTSINDLDDKINLALEEAKQLRIEYENLKIGIEAARERIKRSSLDEQKRLNDAAAAKQGLATAGAIAGIATSFYVGPQAGAAVATGFQVAGNIAYAHNTNGINITTINEIIKSGSEFYEAMDGVIKKWDALTEKKKLYQEVRNGKNVLRGPPPEEGKKDERKPYEETEAASELGISVLEFGTAIVAIAASTKTPTPQALDLSQKESLDPQLQEYLELLSKNQKRLSEVLAETQGLTNAKTTVVAEVAELESSLRSLLEIKPINDLDYALWVERARYIWINEIRNIIQQIYILQRSYFFETGFEVPIRTDLLTFPSTLNSVIDAGAVDVLAPGKEVTKADVVAHLRSQRSMIVVSASSVLKAITHGVEDYLSRHQQKQFYSRAVEFRVDDKDPNRRAFVNSVNAQIALSIARRKAGYTITGSTPKAFNQLDDGTPAAIQNDTSSAEFISLYIPFLFEPAASANDPPLRFIRARVKEVQWRDTNTSIGDDGIEFTVVHPGYGEIGSRERWRFFDLRENDAVNEMRFKTTMFMINTKINPNIGVPSSVIGDDYYTFYPARTDYFLVIGVTSSNWRRAPSIRSITIVWELLQ